ncbi:hypothetical protein [Streptomyces scabiei]|uniref:hypothetical protein n=1 Tax=Streptomyces scabiei TaxID=1930 RepID=UPI001B340C4A|nr:hypothetical protein [Streptomyces sp. LBUM 1483]
MNASVLPSTHHAPSGIRGSGSLILRWIIPSDTSPDTETGRSWIALRAIAWAALLTTVVISWRTSSRFAGRSSPSRSRVVRRRLWSRASCARTASRAISLSPASHARSSAISLTRVIMGAKSAASILTWALTASSSARARKSERAPVCMSWKSCASRSRASFMAKATSSPPARRDRSQSRAFRPTKYGSTQAAHASGTISGLHFPRCTDSATKATSTPVTSSQPYARSVTRNLGRLWLAE